VIPDRQRGDVDDQQQDVRGAGRPAHIAPAQTQPADRGDTERRERIDLGFVAVLHSVKANAERIAAAAAPPTRRIRLSSASNRYATRNRHPAPGRRKTGAHQIQSPRVLADADDIGPDMADQHEERRARRMGNTEHFDAVMNSPASHRVTVGARVIT